MGRSLHPKAQAGTRTHHQSQNQSEPPQQEAVPLRAGRWGEQGFLPVGRRRLQRSDCSEDAGRPNTGTSGDAQVLSGSVGCFVFVSFCDKDSNRVYFLSQ